MKQPPQPLRTQDTADSAAAPGGARAGAHFRVGDWSVRPATGALERDGQHRRLPAQTMRLLELFAAEPGGVL
ncbi:MAG: hypothetical protein AAGM22_26815, partial [Acidobacteriota bacterium]